MKAKADVFWFLSKPYLKWQSVKDQRFSNFDSLQFLTNMANTLENGTIILIASNRKKKITKKIVKCI